MFPHIPFPFNPYWAVILMLFRKIFIDVIFKYHGKILYRNT